MTGTDLTHILATCPEAEVHFTLSQSWGDLNNISLQNVEVKTTFTSDGKAEKVITVHLREENDTPLND